MICIEKKTKPFVVAIACLAAITSCASLNEPKATTLDSETPEFTGRIAEAAATDLLIASSFESGLIDQPVIYVNLHN